MNPPFHWNSEPYFRLITTKCQDFGSKSQPHPNRFLQHHPVLPSHASGSGGGVLDLARGDGSRVASATGATGATGAGAV